MASPILVVYKDKLYKESDTYEREFSQTTLKQRVFSIRCYQYKWFTFRQDIKVSRGWKAPLIQVDCVSLFELVLVNNKGNDYDKHTNE